MKTNQKPLRVLVACEYSGTVRDAFIARGHDALSCDLLETEKAGPHYRGDVFNIIGDGWDLMIAHPPCTYLCRSGWHWVNKPDRDTHPMKGEPRRKAAMDAAQFFRMLLGAPIERIAVENPRPISHVNLPQFSQIIQPHEFGHGEVKGTCLWLKGLPPLMATMLVTGRSDRLHRLPPSPDRWKERSRTYQGIADAMAEQWGNYDQ